MWPFLVAAAHAADPAAPPPSTPVRVGRPFGLEAGFSLAAPMAGLGFGPGVRLLGEVAVLQRLTIGGEVALRLPSSAEGTISDDAIPADLHWETDLVVLGGGPRVAFAFGPLDKLHGRVAVAGGVAWLEQDTVSEAGLTQESWVTGWVCPQVGGLLPLGPGWLTADVMLSVAPAPLLVLGPDPGGTAPALVVGYRWPH